MTLCNDTLKELERTTRFEVVADSESNKVHFGHFEYLSEALKRASLINGMTKLLPSVQCAEVPCYIVYVNDNKNKRRHFLDGSIGEIYDFM